MPRKTMKTSIRCRGFRWRRETKSGHALTYIMMNCIAGFLSLLVFSHAATAVQRETTSEKAENLEKQVKGGLFNFWTFDKQPPGSVPEGFVAETYGEGPAGLWKIDAEPTAPSVPHAVAATSHCETCFQLLVAQGLHYEYPDLAVRVRHDDGRGGIGIVFGLTDAKNFYAALVDLPGKTLRVIRVVNGSESTLGHAPLKSKPVEWHTIRVQRNTIISKDFIETFFDGQITLSVEDQSLGLGQIGLLVQGTVSAHFDSFNAAPLYSHRPVSPPAAY